MRLRVRHFMNHRFDQLPRDPLWHGGPLTKPMLDRSIGLAEETVWAEEHGVRGPLRDHGSDIASINRQPSELDTRGTGGGVELSAHLLRHALERRGQLPSLRSTRKGLKVRSRHAATAVSQPPCGAWNEGIALDGLRNRIRKVLS